jgi:hypothetical protein
MGRTEFSTRIRIGSEPGLDLALLQLERNGALLRVHGEVLSKHA